MNLRKLLYMTTIILAVVSCKKDEEYESKPSLNGALRIMGLPEFIAPGETVTMEPSGVTHPDGSSIEYSWKVTPSQTEYSVADVFTHTFSDTLRTYTVYCQAAAEGYSSTSGTSYTTVVAPGYKGSIQGISYNTIAEDSVYVRHMPYYYKTIGAHKWTLNNMAVRKGIPFREAEVMSEVFGRFYNFSEAKAACDSLDTETQNWELPSSEDWAELEAYISGETAKSTTYGKTTAAAMMVDAEFNDMLMWEYWPQVGEITNGSGFSVIPVGYANIEACSFSGEFEYAAFWTSDEATSTEAYYKYIMYNQPGIFTGKGNKESFGASVRCILK